MLKAVAPRRRTPDGSARAEPPSKIRVLVADHQALVRTGVSTLVNRQPDMAVVAEAVNADSLRRLIDEHHPDLIVIDPRMFPGGGGELIAQIGQNGSGVRLVILTTLETDDLITRGLQAGAKGFLLKDSSGEELVNGLRDVHAGKTVVAKAVAIRLAERMTHAPPTTREMAVLRLVARGRSNKEIARELFISEGTVKIHLTHLFVKLGACSRTEAIASAVRRGLVRIE